ncbi:MAG: hypothetical protein K6E29_01700 [Cyanobacteria bacterium RUI128]|nr:hypothetical protein [Cyanobacteria bacterium RUI128]
MLENVNSNLNNSVSVDEQKLVSSEKQKRVAFKANPNAVDYTPSADTYTNNLQAPPPEMSFGQKFLRYIIPTWGGLHLGTTLYDKANSGKYEHSLVGRLGKLGDKISRTWIVRNPFIDTLRSHGRTIKSNIQNFIDRHPSLSAMQKTPTKPESKLVTNFLETQNEADLKEASAKIQEYVTKGPKTLNEAGATKAEIEALKAKYGTNALGRIKNQGRAIEEFLLGKIGADLGHANMVATVEAREAAMLAQLQKYQAALASPNLTPIERNFLTRRIGQISELTANYRANTLRGLKLRAMGLTKGTLEAVTANPEANGQLINQAIGNATRYSSRLSQYANKVKSIFEPTSKIGKFLPRMSKLGMRGLTFGGGLFNTLFVAFFLGDAVKNTIDAPKEQKVGTAVHGLMDAMSWVIAMPIALKGMHAVNGLKNLGKSQAQVKAYEAALKTFNEQAKAGLFKSHAHYNNAWKAVESLKNAGTAPKGFQKVLSKVASFLSIGLGQKEPFRRNTEALTGAAKRAAKIANFKGKMPNFLRNCVGYPLRFALYMAVFQPIVDKVFSGITTALFGKAYDPEKIKEEYEKAHKGDALKQLQYEYRLTNVAPDPEAVKGLKNVDEESLDDSNIIKQELVRRGILKQGSKGSKQNAQPTQWDSVNGVSVNVSGNNNPYMPPEQGANTGMYPQGNGNKPKDPNQSDYDVVPRTYVPKIDWKNPIPYADPRSNPASETSYEREQRLNESTDVVMQNIDKYLRDKD